MLYVAYGSNINQDQMTYRVPGAKPVGKGLISDWRLAFHGTDGTAYATIVHDPGHVVPVVIWEMSDAQEQIMDVYEGYPSAYYKKKIAVCVNGQRKHGMVYIMNESRVVARPSRKYVNTIRHGYQSFGIDESYLNDALTRNAEDFYQDDLLEMRDFKSFKRKRSEVSAFKASTNVNKKKEDRDVVIIPTRAGKDPNVKRDASYYLRKTGSGVTYWSKTPGL